MNDLLYNACVLKNYKVCAPPCGAAILYNRLYCPKSITWVQGSTHLHVPPKAQRMTWRDAPQATN